MINELTPRAIVAELDKFIIGQTNAKKAVAIALRNRWRRQHVAGDLRSEITPKNILMMGPTGVGKTEIARRLAKLANAPFIKVEATKFTEVGYVGRDVETIIRDLVDMAIKSARLAAKASVTQAAKEKAENRILDALLPPPRDAALAAESVNSATRNAFRAKLRAGELDDKEIDIELAAPTANMEIMGPPGMEDMTKQLQEMFAGMRNEKRNSQKMTVKAALAAVIEEESDDLINEDQLRSAALEQVEQNGIVFIDEIDKICTRSDVGGADVSRQGVQRDLLPLVEGTTVNTKYGMVKTDHILFIASGAFHLAKPSDLIPELQGRFPIRVELESLSSHDFERILTQTDAALTKQYQALFATEGASLSFDASGIAAIAATAFEVNERVENIGARRLYTVMEKMLEAFSFTAGDTALGDQNLLVTAEFVKNALGELAKKDDVSRYVL